MDKQKIINTVVKILMDNNFKSQKIHVQKFISFLSYRVKNIPFHFEIYKYGPFSSDLSDELNSMVLWGDILYEDQQYKYIQNTPVLDDNEYEAYKKEIMQYAELINNLSFENMEIYGTLFYILNETKMTDEKEILKLFHEEKHNKYKDEQLVEPLKKMIKSYFTKEKIQ